jgi:signal transduction histidine kinase
LMSSNTILFWLLLMVDWLSYIFLFTTGFTLACLVYFLTTPDPSFDFHIWWGVAAQFIASFIVVAFFARSKQQFDTQKLRTIFTIGHSIAHELRTPLRTILSGANGIKKYLPDLVETYRIAKQENLKIPEIDPVHHEVLNPALDNIEKEVEAAFNFIDMLLVNANQSDIARDHKLCSMVNCVEQALSRYPFDLGERDLVHWNCAKDFWFMGNELLMTHILFNLLKNAVYYVRAARKGEILIWLESSEGENLLYFKDTGQGISAKILSRIFERFFSATRHGTGIGLAFCKMAMRSLGGDIICRSEEGKYTEFVLTFPKVPAQLQN